MMTFKEIDERINHYEEEIEWSANLIKRLNEILVDEESKSLIENIEKQKMKVEFFCFVTSNYLDLLCTYRNLKRAKSDWEKYYNIKIAYLISYETINTYHKFKGQIYKTVDQEEKDFYKQFFDMLNREVSEFKEIYDYDNVMSKIRNKSIAHYDRNFLDYYSSFELIDNNNSKDIVRSFLNFINPLHYFTYGLIKGEIDQFLFIDSWMS
ncbi:MAG: hypothetical protein APF83_14165 [Lutibacter sp. BRH_c52]|nr:MAG: hypothetical protein APF83_14165 [Lutibacter sp. BRH_c52]